MRIPKLPLLFCAVLCCLSSCNTTASSGEERTGTAEEYQRQKSRISQEPTGDYWVGRRFHLLETRLWGYIRRPRQSWDKSKLVIMNESQIRVPDRLSETHKAGTRTHGFDHNYEYHILGDYTGDVAYDPNSDLVLPEFRATDFRLFNPRPGFLLNPGDTYDQRDMPRWD